MGVGHVLKAQLTSYKDIDLKKFNVLGNPNTYIRKGSHLIWRYLDVIPPVQMGFSGYLDPPYAAPQAVKLGDILALWQN